MPGSNNAHRLAGPLIATALGLFSISAASAQAPVQSGDKDLIAKGEYLARAGDCVACHSGSPDKPYAGGLPINTPFGVIYSPNITPDQKTGIGTWTDDQFYRAMHEGVGKDGENLYPVFPYPWYTKVTRDDAVAIKAYLFSLPPIDAPLKPNTFSFPFSVRTALDGWKLLYLKEGTFAPDPKASAEVNRGAYLVQGLGHCAECHTQLNALGAPELTRSLAGGAIDGWFAPNISSDIQNGIGGWAQADIVTYLKTGTAPGKGIAVGPMAQVVHDSLSHLTDADVNAIAAYLKSTPAKNVTPVVATSSSPTKPGSATYLTYCSSCHQLNGQGVGTQIPALASNGTVTAGGSENILRVVLGGLEAKDTYGPMPAIGADMTDQEIADVANYVRTEWGNGAPPNASPGLVGELRQKTPLNLASDSAHCQSIGQSDFATAITKSGSGVSDAMKVLTDDNLIDGVGKLVRQVKQISAKTPQADIVNGLTSAYCPIVADDSRLQANQKRWRLQRFSQLVYGDLVADTGKAAQK